MSHHTTSPKIQNFVNDSINKKLFKWHAMLVAGNIYEFEQELHKSCRCIYEFVCEQLLPMASVEAGERLAGQGQEAGGRKIRMRPLTVRIGTGKRITVRSPYVKKPGKDWAGPRHLMTRHWNIIGGSTPALYDKVGYCAALGPSYETGCQTLQKFGVHVCQSSVRHLTNRLSARCFELGEENLVLEPQQDLSAKTVVISVDGGRTRTRKYTGLINEAGNRTYGTPWREPKLFVIDVLDENGRPDRYELPIYGCRFAEEDVMELLGRYLKKLKIDKALRVQVVADGAPWIWNNIKPVLRGLNVAEGRITETLDYYHASKYIFDLVEQLPKHIGKKQRKACLQQFKDWLWAGSAELIVQECEGLYKRPGKLVKRWMNYLKKHSDKTQYADYKADGLMCASGIIESAVRRIICLRFKNASTFWHKEQVEQLYFLRAALLSKRWDLVMNNLTGAAA